MHVIDLTWLSYVTFAVVAYYAVLFLHPLYQRGRRRPSTSATAPFMVLVIPAHNEEDVLGTTLESLTALDYDDRLILVMNDGSGDRTSEIARRFEDRGVRVVDRAPAIAGRGKGAVLNHAFAIVSELVQAGDPALRGRTPEDVVVGIMDADGQLERGALNEVAPYFTDQRVGGVQIGVRIANAPTNVLTRMQDLEFVGFSAFVQQARNSFGSVGLGGNGQFTRLSALQTLRRDPWTDCLTEDLELSLSLAEHGWRITYCADTFVAQQGLTKWRPLLRQRTRWIQGHYQCWRHLPSIWTAHRMPLLTRLDLTIYLLMVTFVMIVFGGVATALVADLMGFAVVNDSLAWIEQEQLHNAAQLALSIGPLAGFLATYQARSRHPLRAWELPAFALAFSLYAYMFVASQVWAWARAVGRRGSWAKTPRVAAQPAT